jgi:biotin carboxyl carrier protein
VLEQSTRSLLGRAAVNGESAEATELKSRSCSLDAEGKSDAMDFEFLIGEKEETLSLEEKDGLCLARFGDTELRAEVFPVSSNMFWITSSGQSFVVYAAKNEGKYYVFVRGQQFCIEKPSTELRRRAKAGGALKAEEIVGAPMPGVIVKVPVSEGDVVKAEEVLVVVESMKMENDIRASGDARVKKVHVKSGDSVNFGSPLVELEPVSE